MEGWIKIYRKISDKGWYQHSEYVHLWLHLLIKAVHKDQEFLSKGQTVVLKPGQFITGRNALSKETGINPSKIERMLNTFENEHQIEQQKNNLGRLISIVYWEKYQTNEHQKEQPVNIKRTASEQRINTYKNNKNIKNIKNEKKNNIGADSPMQIQPGLHLEEINEDNPHFLEFQSWINENTPRVAQMQEPFTQKQYKKIINSIPRDQLTDLLMAMHNRADLLKKYRSAYLTLLNWSKYSRFNEKTLNHAKPTKIDGYRESAAEMREFYDKLEKNNIDPSSISIWDLPKF